MGWDDVQKKKPRLSPHAHDPYAKGWADDFTRLAFDPRYEKQAAPYSKRRNGTYRPVDENPGGFYGISRKEHLTIQAAVGTVALYSIYRAVIKKPILGKPESFITGAITISLAYWLANKL